MINLEEPWLNEFNPTVTQLDVYYFFRHILGRNPSKPEWPGHCGFIGKDLSEVISTYLNSPEFRSRKLAGFSPKGVTSVKLDNFLMYLAENDHAVGAHILANKNYEPAVTKVFNDLLKPGMNAVDIGANIGWFSMLSASLVGDKGHVFSFEPSPINGRFLELNKLANKFDQITIIHAAASNKTESLIYNSSFSNGFVSNVAHIDPASILDSELVFGIPVDHALSSSQEQIHLVKVDVEGWEMKALYGAKELLEKWKPHIVLEFSPPALSSCSQVSGEYLLTWLLKLGYNFNVIEEGGVKFFGNNTTGIVDAYEQSGKDHIDLLCSVH
jgi:FkbM family methyltransferase